MNFDYAKMVCCTTTAKGTQVRKWLLDEPVKGKDRLFKEIVYTKDSKLGQLGIDSVVIKDAKEKGKQIFVCSRDGKYIASGVTKPADSYYSWSVIAQLKSYIEYAKSLLRKGESIR